MTDIPDTFLTDIFNTINGVINSFVQNTYHQLISNNATAITLIFTLYVAILGYRFLHDNSYSSDIGTVTRHLLFMSIIYALIMSWSWYNNIFYNIFTNEPEKISTIIVSASGQSVPDAGGTVLQALDSVWSTGMGIAAKFFMQAGLTKLQFYFYAYSTFGVTLVLCLFALGLFLYAKLAMAIALALGPIFILFMLFKPTRGFAQSWIQHLVNFALIPIITSAIIALMYTIINKTLGDLNVSDASQGFSDICAYDLVVLLTVFLMFQVLPMSSALAGGVTLSSIEGGIRTAYNALKGKGNSSGNTKSGGSKGGSGNKKSGGSNSDRKAAQIKKMRQQSRANAASKK